jgi:glycosyltransferase involved in cell wall biosynthesis
MKVLAISSYGGLGGSELSFATFLAHRPAAIDARALVIGDEGLPGLLAQDGTRPRVAFGYEARPTALRFARFTRSLLRVLDEEPPDVIWAMAQKATLLGLPAARLRRIPIVWHKVDFSWDQELALPVAAAVNAVISVSSAAAQALGPLRRRRLLGVVGPPVTLGEAANSRPDPQRPTIGTLARLVPYKGHHHIIEAAALLRSEFPTLRVVLAGAEAPEYPGYRDSLVALARERGLGADLELPGFAPAANVLSRLTVYANATHRDSAGFGLEGLSGAMLEASWTGVPVVATRGGGTAEGLIDGQTGTLVEGSAPETLAEAIRPYLRDPALAARIGKAGRRFARDRFAPDTVSRRLYGLLALAANERR